MEKLRMSLTSNIIPPPKKHTNRMEFFYLFRQFHVITCLAHEYWLKHFQLNVKFGNHM